MNSVIMTLIKTYQSKKEETDDNLYMRWEQDQDLTLMPDLGLFDEYLEMGKIHSNSSTAVVA